MSQRKILRARGEGVYRLRPPATRITPRVSAYRKHFAHARLRKCLFRKWSGRLFMCMRVCVYIGSHGFGDDRWMGIRVRVTWSRSDLFRCGMQVAVLFQWVAHDYVFLFKRKIKVKGFGWKQEIEINNRILLYTYWHYPLLDEIHLLVRLHCRTWKFAYVVFAHKGLLFFFVHPGLCKVKNAWQSINLNFYFFLRFNMKSKYLNIMEK